MDDKASIKEIIKDWPWLTSAQEVLNEFSRISEINLEDQVKSFLNEYGQILVNLTNIEKDENLSN